MNINILGLLGVAFVVLKLLGHIDWSWWYVTMPFWIGFVIIIATIVLPIIVAALLLLISWTLDQYVVLKRKWKKK